MKINNHLMLFFITMTFSCTLQPSYYSKMKSSPLFLEEKETLIQKLNGKKPCFNMSFASFTYPSNTPDQTCIYHNYGSVQDGSTMGSGLEVLQRTKDGFLLQYTFQRCSTYDCYDDKAPNLIFLHKTDEQDGLIDGSNLGSYYPWDFYEYVGIYSYETQFGQKTVYSFKRIFQKRILDIQKGFKAYSIYAEMHAERGAWKDLEETSNTLKMNRK